MIMSSCFHLEIISESWYWFGLILSYTLLYHSSSIDLSNIAAAVYSTLLCNRIRAFLSAVPPSCPQPHVNELLIAVSDFERSLDSWGIRFEISFLGSKYDGTNSFSLTIYFILLSPVQGGIDSRGLFHNYIMVWIHDMELRLLDRCKAEKVIFLIILVCSVR